MFDSWVNIYCFRTQRSRCWWHLCSTSLKFCMFVRIWSTCHLAQICPLLKTYLSIFVHISHITPSVSGLCRTSVILVLSKYFSFLHFFHFTFLHCIAHSYTEGFSYIHWLFHINLKAATGMLWVLFIMLMSDNVWIMDVHCFIWNLMK